MKNKYTFLNKDEIQWELRDTEHGPEFSASALLNWNPRLRDWEMGGQCLEEFAKKYPHDLKVAQIVRIWRKYHLNGMNAGTPAQHAEIDRRLKENPEDLQNPPYNGDYYYFACGVLKDAGLYEVPLNPDMHCTGGFPEEVKNGTRGYRYGERWLYRSIPEPVLMQIRDL